MILTPSETLYLISKALNISNEEMLEIYHKDNYKIEEEYLVKILKRKYDKDFTPASYEDLGCFLDALISFKRGKVENKKEQEQELDNNLVLKKLRIALELKEEDLKKIFKDFSKNKISAFFRAKSSEKFKKCSDEVLISFLNELELFYEEKRT